MLKGEKIRFDAHNILFSIWKFNKTLEDGSIKQIYSNNKKEDISFLNTVTLNSMRYRFHTTKIINKFVKKKLREQEYILFLSAVTQIVFLDFKEYAVINCTVEIAKKLKIYHGFVNAVLKKIASEKKLLKNIIILFRDLPLWFVNRTKNFTNIEREIFLKNFYNKPDIHIVFKNNNKFLEFNNKIKKTSDLSGYLLLDQDIKNIKSFKNGDWWVQDFSSFLPIHNLPIKIDNKKILDACAAPGGKAFQILAKTDQIVLNDKSKERIKILNSNLKRLNYKTTVLNQDFIEFKYNHKFDLIIIDAPCSAVGTIRKNPEIFFKRKSPNFNQLTKIQEQMLERASKLLNKNGLILYMVCSFLKVETENQINKFLKKNDNFKLCDLDVSSKNKYTKLIRNKYIFTLPDKFLNYNIDGYFGAYLKKTQ